VAVVGIGVRLPGGVDSPESFWDLLIDRREAVQEVPPERWRVYRDLGPAFEAAVRRCATHGSFLPGIDGFDAEFFGIAPREAEEMDPQQRILLEVSWEALEHAGIPPHTLAGTDAGVFMGVCTNDYGARLMEDLPTIEAWTGIGGATCAIANRISHVLDLRGPSLAVDTACSSSHVALHLACQSLLVGESDVALAGGVNLIISPGYTVTLGAAGALSPDGRSKPFDADADGYGRGDGCGVVVLKRLADAERDGDRVLAVVRGSAVNQDGRTEGIMAPCGEAQEHAARHALRRAGVEASTVDYIEAHGTGTRLGDPLEAAALTAAYGTTREPGDPVLIGSVKSNIGHSEGAAGVAAFIKAVLAVQRGQVPPSILRGAPNPAIDWPTSGLRLATEATAWPGRDGPRRAAVAGAGYGGTVAHLVLEQAAGDPSGDTAGEVEDQACGPRLYPISAESQDALAASAARLADHLDAHGDAGLAAIGGTLGNRRTHLSHRAVAIAADRAELVTALRSLAGGEPAPEVVTGTTVPTEREGVVWIFSGHGSQWVGMGRELLATEPVFARVINELGPVFQDEIGFTPRRVLLDGELDTVDKVQTMIFAMQVGLAALWRAAGVEPAAVIGHSVGEIAAAVVAGALSPQDGARLVCRRSVLMREVAGKGAMALVGLPFAEVARRLAGRTDLVPAIAASPVSTVVAGDPDAVEEVIGTWPDDGITVRRVAADVASHSPHMAPLVDRLVTAVRDLRPRPPAVPFYSTVLAQPRMTEPPGAGYWAKNLREPVRFADAVAAAAHDGFRAFLEVSPHPVVAHSVNETLEGAGIEDAFVGVTLRRDRPERLSLATAIAAAHVAGVPVGWPALQPSTLLADLPTYAWQHRALWRDPDPGGRTGGRGHDPASHTLLGDPGTVAGTSVRVWRTTLDDGNRPYPSSHRLGGVELIPAAALVVTFLAAAQDPEIDAAPALREVSMKYPLTTADRKEIQVVQDGGELLIASLSEGSWLVHTAARIADPTGLPGTLGPLPGDARRAEPGLVRQRLADIGTDEIAYDWTVTRLWHGGGTARAQLSAPGAGSWAPIFDAAMSLAPVAFDGPAVLRLVGGIDEVSVTGAPPETVIIDATRRAGDPDLLDVLVATPDGAVVAGFTGLRYPTIEELPEGLTVDEPEGDTDSFAALTPEERKERIIEEVRTQIATEMRLPATRLDVRKPLVKQGLDSVMTVVIRRKLEKRYGQMLPAALFWQQPTVVRIAEHITDLLPV
jgi:6-methylsalicylic acid synthase